MAERMLHRCVPDGDCNAGFVGKMWSTIDRLSEARENVVLDLSGVDFIDSHGAGALASLIRRLALKGLQLKIVGLHGQPLRLLLDLHLVSVSGVATGAVNPPPRQGRTSPRLRRAIEAASHELSSWLPPLKLHLRAFCKF